MRTPADVLADLVRADPTAPRLTAYDDTPSGGGERIELSAKVLANWVAKAANALQEEWDVEPGTRVRLLLPPHWRLAYWAYAVWSVGAAVDLTGGDGGAGGRDVSVTVSDDPAVVAEADGERVLVTLAALARRSPVPVPTGAIDEAASIATYADQFDAWASPAATDVAVVDSSGEATTYGSWPSPALEVPPGARVHTATADPATFLRQLHAAWSAGGSLVLSRGAAGRDVAARLASEGVTVDLAAG
ncbi:MAG: TIGR03089 family protein [Nostocoides sp.]